MCFAQPTFITAFGLTKTDLPTLVAFHPKKLRGAQLKGAYSAQSIDALLDGLFSGQTREHLHNASRKFILEWGDWRSFVCVIRKGCSLDQDSLPLEYLLSLSITVVPVWTRVQGSCCAMC